MGSVYKRGRTWWLNYKDATGEWTPEATKALTKAEAKGRCRRWQHQSPGRRGVVGDPTAGPRLKRRQLLVRARLHDHHHRAGRLVGQVSIDTLRQHSTESGQVAVADDDEIRPELLR